MLTQQPYNDNFCLFRAFTVHLQGKTNFETATLRFCKKISEKLVCDGLDHLPIVQDAVEKKVVFYNIDIEDGDFEEELARRSIGKNKNTIKLLKYNKQNYHVNKIDNYYQCFRC